MRIAQVAPLYERVPPHSYGGTERVVSYLTEELVRLGHDVTLFASGDSVTAARLRAGSPGSLRLDPQCVDPLAYHFRMLTEVYRRAAEFDIIHCHTDYLSLPHARGVATPTLVTLHGRLDIPELAPLYALYDDVPLVSISDAQRGPLPAAHWVATVYHGLPERPYRFAPTAGEYLLFLGRISPEKRPDIAIHVAARTGRRLLIAAKVDAADREYFARTIRPMLDAPHVEFLGEVDEDRKIELLAGAGALMFPIDWPEPFGLVMIEALAVGTPIIARPCGSVPEVVRHGETGWIGDSEDDLVEAVRGIDAIDRRACRADFERRFTASAMAQNYLAVYESILTNRAAGRHAI